MSLIVESRTGIHSGTLSGLRLVDHELMCIVHRVQAVEAKQIAQQGACSGLMSVEYPTDTSFVSDAERAKFIVEKVRLNFGGLPEYEPWLMSS